MNIKLKNDLDPIVMVDDNDDQIYIAKRCYEKSQLKNPFLDFTSGGDLISYLEKVESGQESFPALIFIDVNMPGTSGHELVRYIREKSCFSKRPFLIMLTNSDNPRDVEDAKAAGADGFYTKQSNLSEYEKFFDSFLDLNKRA